MMNLKIVFLLPSLFFFACAYAQTSEVDQVVLKWKLADKDSLIYKATMYEIGDYAFDFDFKGGFYGLFNQNKKTDSIFVERLRQHTTKADYQIKLFKADTFTTALKTIFYQAQGDVLFEGLIADDGQVQSFWLNPKKKNLLSLFFQLPQNAIKKGDVFPLHHNGISISRPFKSLNSEIISKLIVKDIEFVDEKTIVYLNYEVNEYVKGVDLYNFFGRMDDKVKELTYKYKAEGVFSVEKGRWISYVGLLYSYDSSFIGSSVHKIYKLEEN